MVDFRKLSVVVVMMFAAAVQFAAGQEKTATKLAFDVVSVRPDKSGKPIGINNQPDGDGIALHSIPLSWVIDLAFEMEGLGTRVGVPDWAKSERYEIDAKVADADLPAYHKLSTDQRSELLRAVLVDRFKLQFHIETRDVAIYALTVMPKGATVLQVKPGEERTTGLARGEGKFVQGHIIFSSAPGHLVVQEESMSTVAGALSGLAGRKIVDKTGLPGVYDFKLEWDPNSGKDAAMAGDASGLSLFTAMQEQLGLKLDPQKVPMPALVIDHLERPSEN